MIRSLGTEWLCIMNSYQAHQCDFCPGTVQPVAARNEALRVRDKLVLVENVTIGKCDRCGHRYWPAEILKRAERTGEHPEEATRMASIPVVAA